MFLLFFVPAIVWLTLSVWLIRKDDDNLGYIFSFVFSICALIAVILISILYPVNNLGNAARLTAFYEANAENYAVAVQETKDVLTVSLQEFEASLIPIEGSIEKWEQGKEVSKRIVEWRDAVNSYNKSIASMRAYDGNIVLGILYPTLSDELKPIVIE